MSKKAIRRAARDAFPKAKNAPAGKRGGVYSKRTHQAGGGSASGANVPKPPSLKRSFIFALIVAFGYFALIQWAFHIKGSTLNGNLLVSALGLVVFTAANYWSERFRYRRYLKKRQGIQK